MLGLKFAYATNGHEILEFDYSTGLQLARADFPAPTELWERYRAARGSKDPESAERLPTPSNHQTGKSERYYQQAAISAAPHRSVRR
jgi:type I restriction enzyme R subunit